MIVAKVGGSLYDEPRLGPALRRWLGEQSEPVLLVPGGGAFADAVRALDRVHRLGEEQAHWLAIRSLGVAGEFLRRMVWGERPPPVAGYAVADLPLREGGMKNSSPPDGEVGTRSVPGGGCSVLDCLAFFTRHDLTPHTWAVTTDSLALAAAIHLNASRLVLLKSIDIPPGTPWPEAAARGWVDAHFPTLAADTGVPIVAVNFRRWIESHFGPPGDEVE